MSDHKAILVTGGCGFIGSQIFDRLLWDGNKFLVKDDLYYGVF
jgi:UDP-glucose 4-epimerase